MVSLERSRYLWIPNALEAADHRPQAVRPGHLLSSSGWRIGGCFAGYEISFLKM
jgi:hypothetical protein